MTSASNDTRSFLPRCLSAGPRCRRPGTGVFTPLVHRYDERFPASLPHARHCPHIPRRPAVFRAKTQVMYVEARKKLVGWLRSQLIGPAGEGSVRRCLPWIDIPTGVLHPVEPDVTGIDPASTGRDEAESNLHDEPDEDEEATHSGPESDVPTLARPARRRRYVPPSSVGFSCYVRGHVRLSVTAAAAVYRGAGERGERGRFQTRGVHEVRASGNHGHLVGNRRCERDRRDDDLGRTRRESIFARGPHRDGCILTVTLCQPKRAGSGCTPARERTRDRVSKSLFETRLECVIESGEARRLPPDRSQLAH